MTVVKLENLLPRLQWVLLNKALDKYPLVDRTDLINDFCAEFRVPRWIAERLLAAYRMPTPPRPQ